MPWYFDGFFLPPAPPVVSISLPFLFPVILT
jgi:hypothetical protein